MRRSLFFTLGELTEMLTWPEGKQPLSPAFGKRFRARFGVEPPGPADRFVRADYPHARETVEGE